MNQILLSALLVFILFFMVKRSMYDRPKVEFDNTFTTTWVPRAP